MRDTTDIVERAYQLARSGACANASDIAKALHREHFTGVQMHMSAPTLRKQLTAMCKAARTAPLSAGEL